MAVETLSFAPPQLQTHQRESNSGSLKRINFTEFSERVAGLFHLPFDIVRETFHEIQRQTWERKVYRLELTPLPKYSFLNILMAVLRAHQIHTPMKFYEIVSPGSVTKGNRQPTHRIAISDSDLIYRNNTWNGTLYKAQFNGLHPTELVQVVHLLARKRGYSAAEVFKITLNALWATFSKIEFDIEGHYRIDAFSLMIATARTIFRFIECGACILTGTYSDDIKMWDDRGMISRITQE